MSESRGTYRAALKAGVAAGVVGAVAKAGFMILASLVYGKPPLLPLRPLGATFRGEDVVLVGAGSFLYGIAILLVVCAALGAFYAVLLPADFEPAGAALLGVGYALFVQSVITSGILPEVNPVLRYRMPTLGGSWVIAASLWGAALGLVPWLRRRVEQGTAAAPS